MSMTSMFGNAAGFAAGVLEIAFVSVSSEAMGIICDSGELCECDLAQETPARASAHFTNLAFLACARDDQLGPRGAPCECDALGRERFVR